MRIRAIHKITQIAETSLIGQMGQEKFEEFVKESMASELAKLILEKTHVPLTRREIPDKDPARIRNDKEFNEEPAFEYECQFILLNREDFEIIMDNIATIKKRL